MTIAHSRLTSEGQNSVPAEIRKKLGLRPGSVLEWDEKDGEVVVRRARQYTSVEVHEALFGAPPAQKSKLDVKDGIRNYIRRRRCSVHP